MKTFATLAFSAALTVLSASLASAQTTTTVQNPWANTPMVSFFGSQATTVPANTAAPTYTPAAQTTPTNSNSPYDELLALMPMFRFF